MTSMYDDVAHFHKVILDDLFPLQPTLNDRTWAIERYSFLEEEVNEFFDAVREGDIVKSTDGLLDVIYVALGTLYQMGVPVQECWNAVQKANMAKVKGLTKRGMRIDAVKPAGWKDPHADIALAISRKINQTNN